MASKRIDSKINKKDLNMDQPSVWLEFSPLAQTTNSINLGQGFPDWAPPQFVQDAAVKSVQGGHCSTYARSAGHPYLVETLASEYSEQINHKIDPYKEVITTVGASEALFLSITSFIKSNYEVIIIEPAFDIYLGALRMVQANIKTTSLDKSLNLNWEHLESIMNDDTKMLILNTPHNPSGKVFTQDELNKLASILKKYPNCIVLSDEVYEHLVYDDCKHISFASLPGMFERTITVSSAGKTFSTTGWKVGWAIGPESLIKKLQFSQQWVAFSVSKPHQEAIAESLVKARVNNYHIELRDNYANKRELLFNGLTDAGLNPIKPQGSFFILCDISNHDIHKKIASDNILKWNGEGKIQSDTTTYNLHDYNFCRTLSIEHKVTAIPTSAFYLNKEDNTSWARFAFCKDDQTLLDAIKNLKSI